MGQATSNGRSSYPAPPRRRRRAKGKLALIGVVGAMLFVAGFILLWSLGSVIVGGKGFPWTSTASAAISPVALQAQLNRPLEPLVDLRAFRDLSYVPVKGIYVTSYHAGDSKRLAKLLKVADTTEINAMVVDINDDDGNVTYNTSASLARSLGLVRPIIKDVDGFIATLRKHGIVPIARIVTFQNTLLARARPDLAVQSSKGGLWKDYSGKSYLDPYNQQAWDYILDVAEDAAKRGFREIQFDYVRFPADGPVKEALYPSKYGSESAEKSRVDAISGFLAYARQRLEPLGVWISADIFGVVLAVKNDQGIGQVVEKIAQNVDVVCPMIYPSHYNPGSYGIDSPNASPYELITACLKDGRRRVEGTGAMVRPWLQDFSIRGVKYGVAEVRAQIKAAEDLGYTEWILWDPGLTYTTGALRGEGS